MAGMGGIEPYKNQTNLLAVFQSYPVLYLPFVFRRDQTAVAYNREATSTNFAYECSTNELHPFNVVGAGLGIEPA